MAIEPNINTTILHIMGPNGIGKSTAIMKIAVDYLNISVDNHIPSNDNPDSGIYFSEDNQYAIIGKFANKDKEIKMNSGEVSGCTKEEIVEYLAEANARGTKVVLMQGQLVNSQSSIARHYEVVGDNQIILVLQADTDTITARKMERAKVLKTKEKYDELSEKQSKKFSTLPTKIKQEFPGLFVAGIDAKLDKQVIVDAIINLLKSKNLY